MGFMDQFNQTAQQANFSNLMSQARQIAGSNPLAAVQQMANNGVTCNLPNGRVVSVKEMVAMAQGKSAQQFLQDLGLGSGAHGLDKT